MGIFKLSKQKIPLGEWKKKLEISIPTYDLEFKVYNLPFRIGSSPNNDLVLQEEDLDAFQGVVSESDGFLQLFNISLHRLINLKNDVVHTFESIQIEKSTQLNFGKIQLMLMPEIRGRKIKRRKQINIQCPYCGEAFNAKDGCSVCGFGKPGARVAEKVSRFSKILNRVEKEVEAPTVRRNLGGVRGVKLSFILENGPSKGKIIEIPENSSEITIGRSIYNAVSLSFTEDPTMSRFHCKLSIEGDKVLILDNKSLNGTLINGKLIKQKTGLSSGDLIQLGNSLVRVRILKEENYE